MSGPEQVRIGQEFLRRWRATPAQRRHRLLVDVPLAAVQAAALDHPDPWLRRAGLAFLDHHANDASTRTFLEALHDPVAPVRATALHGISCERCRDTPLCVADVVPVLAGVLSDDPSPDIRHKAIPILLGMAGRDDRAGDAIAAAVGDPDPLIRDAARAALDGRYRDARRDRHDAVRRRRSRRNKATAQAG